MRDMCMVLKTYRGDLDYCRRLIKSFHAYNRDDITLFLIVPSSDSWIFDEFAASTVHIVRDEELDFAFWSKESLTFDQGKADRTRFINAWTTRLAFWELGLAPNYFAIDADMEFIRPFGVNDFIDDHGTPFTFLNEYRLLAADPFYYDRYWTPRLKAYEAVKQVVGLRDSRNLNNCTSQMMSGAVLKNFRDMFLVPRGWNYSDAIATVEYEFFWYDAWIQYSNIIPVVAREDCVLVVQHQGHHLALHAMGVTKQRLSNGYLGVIVNSNWSRQYGLVDFDSPLAEEYHTRGLWARWVNGEPARSAHD